MSAAKSIGMTWMAVNNTFIAIRRGCRHVPPRLHQSSSRNSKTTRTSWLRPAFNHSTSSHLIERCQLLNMETPDSPAPDVAEEPGEADG
jgi:hypothetical protein